MLALDKVYHAAFVLKNVVKKTDTVKATEINPKSNIFLKTENLQLTGSFKVRGAYYKISQLSEEEKSHGVIACSAGNHAQGVALAATKNGIKSIICLPDGAPISKVEATKKYGAEVCLVKGVYDDAYNKAVELQKEHNYTFIHPFNDIDVIAGQGTIGLEILDQIPDLDAVIVPVGGGGLIAGIGFVVKTLNPSCKVYGVQSSGAPSMVNSLRDNNINNLEKVSTIADGIAVKTPGDITFDFCKKYVDEIVTVTDDEVASAILALMEKHKIVTEGAGAVSVAAAMFDKVDIAGKNTACIVSGGNIDVTILSRVISRGLLKAGRSLTLTFELSDKPGQLEGISHIIADLGGNIVSIYHDRYDMDIKITSCILEIRLETRDHNHCTQIIDALKSAGYKIL